jgi:Family of unknown function (DUF5906)
VTDLRSRGNGGKDSASILAQVRARKREERAATTGVKKEDFYAYMPQHRYIYTPTREPWPASSVNARLGKIDGIEASIWLDQNRPVEQMTWAPGEPMIIGDRLATEGGWIERAGVSCLNLYIPPALERGDPDNADLWLQHVAHVYPDEADHIVAWLAHRVQRPAEKINHAIVMGGAQGIGKDTILAPVKHAIGPWNFQEVSPSAMLGRFNGFVKSVLLRVSEARDLGDVNRYAFYDHLKMYTAAPPEVLRCDEKNLREHLVLNCCGVIITSNHKADGIYLPSDDRRHYVAWSDRVKEDFTADYWRDLWGWYNDGGIGHVAAYLANYDLSAFNPFAPPPKTPAFWDIVDAGRAPEDAELADVLDRLGNPDALALSDITCAAGGASAEFVMWWNERRNRRQIPYRMESCGYTPVRNEAAKDGYWKVGATRQVIYAKRSLHFAARHDAANNVVRAGG